MCLFSNRLLWDKKETKRRHVFRKSSSKTHFIKHDGEKVCAVVHYYPPKGHFGWKGPASNFLSVCASTYWRLGMILWYDTVGRTREDCPVNQLVGIVVFIGTADRLCYHHSDLIFLWFWQIKQLADYITIILALNRFCYDKWNVWHSILFIFYIVIIPTSKFLWFDKWNRWQVTFLSL